MIETLHCLLRPCCSSNHASTCSESACIPNTFILQGLNLLLSYGFIYNFKPYLESLSFLTDSELRPLFCAVEPPTKIPLTEDATATAFFLIHPKGDHDRVAALLIAACCITNSMNSSWVIVPF